MESDKGINKAPNVECSTENVKQCRDLEEVYRSHSGYALKIKDEYDQENKELAQQLNRDHLKPIAETVLKYENIVIKDEPLLESLKQSVYACVQKAFDDFWSEYNVENSLITLQILKDKFKKYEGRNWNITKISPSKRTLPMRMHFKHGCRQHLNKQLKYQESLLKDLYAANASQRVHLQEVSQERVFLLEQMDKATKRFKDMGPQLINLTEEVLNSEN